MSEFRDLIDSRIADPTNARKAVRAAKIDERVGRLANGEFLAPGVISTSYIDHGTGANILNYNDVDFSARPVGAYYYNGATISGVQMVEENNYIDQDVIQVSTASGALSNWIPLTNPSQTHTADGQHSYVASINTFNMFNDLTGTTVELRVKTYATFSNALSDVSALYTYTSTPLTTFSGEFNKIAMQFTPEVGGVYLRMEVRVGRNDGAAGVLPASSIWQLMLEEVEDGQTKASKFTLPVARRNTMPAALLEGQALQGYISGLGVSKNAATNPTLGVAIESGAAYVPGIGRVVSYAGGTTTVTSTAGVKYFYLESDALGNGSIVVSSAPSTTPYVGTARTASGNTFRRFIGCVVVFGGEVVLFEEKNGYVTFQNPVENRVLVNNTVTANTGTDLDVSGWMPSFTRLIRLRLRLSDTVNATVRLGTNGLTLVAAGESIVTATVTPNSQRSREIGDVRTSVNNIVTYACTTNTATVSIDVIGYWYER